MGMAQGSGCCARVFGLRWARSHHMYLYVSRYSLLRLFDPAQRLRGACAACRPRLVELTARRYLRRAWAFQDTRSRLHPDL